MTQQEAAPLRFFLGLLALVTLAAQLVVVPCTAAHYAARYAEVAHLEPLYGAALVLALVCFQIALLAAWCLVSAAVVDGTLSGRTVLWNNIMTASLSGMVIILAGTCVHAGLVESVGGPAMLFGLLISTALVPASFALRNRVARWFTPAGTVHS